jgi:hypothetical protein
MSETELLIAIKDRLWNYYVAKQQVKKMRVDIMAIAVELGLDQKVALKIDVSDWLNGYLTANGVESNYKREMENE